MQLFSLDDDPGETKNLVAEHPDRVEAMIGLLQNQVDDGVAHPGKRSTTIVT
jgi:hypothetical protein